ncbi:MAG: peptide chain release factor N(5)-glutamine methyltransferase [Peptococcaceae bacterium]|nr:peptide chain release factor N(5)-glutamine methyltransferase [Peptococcaceae bacterium]MDH7523732.1 peptide chain release factor N(5)-glutamine methyltransferase [Peptococcaceae bacterium]
MTGREALQWAVSLLAGLGLDKRVARLESRLILEKAWGKKGLKLITDLDELLDEDAQEKYMSLIGRRVRREPLQYIVEEQEFMSLPFKVSPDVLIPRWDSELLAEEAIGLGKSFVEPRILDIGTGSGAIAVSLAFYLPRCRVWAVDISGPALEVARQNARRNGVGDRVEFLKGDLFAPLPPGIKFHLIVSNPPYLTEEELASLAEEVKKEPRIALDGGKDGLEFYKEIIPAAFEFLLPGGSLLLEVGWQQGGSAAEIMARHGYSRLRVKKDYQGKDRVVIGEKTRE